MSFLVLMLVGATWAAPSPPPAPGPQQAVPVPADPVPADPVHADPVQAATQEVIEVPEGPSQEVPEPRVPSEDAPQEAPTQRGWFALVGGVVHTMVPGSTPERATVVIGEGLVQAVGPEVEAPPGCELIDISGLHVLPGLVDGMAYHDPRHDALFTVRGVTLLRDHGNDLGLILSQHPLDIRDARAGPALSISGAPLDGDPPSTTEALVLETRERAAFQTKALIDAGVDFLSFQPNLGPEERRAVVATAHENGLQVWGVAPALPEGSPAQVMIDEQVDGLLYLDAFLPPGTSWTELDPESAAALAEPFRNARICVTPLLGTTARHLTVEGPESPWFEALSPHYEALWREDWRARESRRDEAYLAGVRTVLDNQRALLVALYQAGIPMIPGSGAPHPWLVPGVSLHAELQEWHRAGLPNQAILEAATREAARALGLSLTRGTCELGKVADLIVVEGDPREDLKHLEQPRSVVLRGRLFEQPDLEDLYRTVVNESSLERERAAQPLAITAPRLPEDCQVVCSGYAEVQSAAGRLSGERWAVARLTHGRMVFAMRGLTTEGTEIELSQEVSSERLEAFHFALRGQQRVFEIEGDRVADKLRVKRVVDGTTLDIRSVPIEISAVDVGSLTTLMLLAHTQPAGEFDVLRFHEGTEMELALWRLQIDDQNQHLFRTPQGAVLAAFDAQGLLMAVAQRQGNTWTKVVTSEVVATEPLGLAAGGGVSLEPK